MHQRRRRTTNARRALTPAGLRRLTRSHRRARRRTPWLQALVALVLVPPVSLMARVRVRGRAHLPKEGGYILAPNHPSVLDGFFAALPVLPRRLSFMGMAELWARPRPSGCSRRSRRWRRLP